MAKKILSKSNQAILIANRAGYRVNRNGVVVSTNGFRQTGYSHNRREPNQYLKVFIPEAKTWIYVHRLAAFGKFGSRMFTPVYVGHKNLKTTDNRPSNIILRERGTSPRTSSAPPRPVTTEEYEIALEMHQKGYTSCDIAARLQRSPRACRLIVERLKANNAAMVA